MANILKNKLYPYIEKYINEYLHGFEKNRIDIQLTKGEVTLEKLSLRPDTINNILDQQNVPFWIKVGLITKIHVGASVLSVIGETPLELEIDGINIILSPSYKWIINNLGNLKDKKIDKIFDMKNPLGNNIFEKKPDEFDISIFIKEKIQEIFKDKSDISKALNGLFKGLYSFYDSPNFSAVIKIKNIHIRFEDDELMNYTGDIAYGLKIKLIQIKVGCKGNMKKDAIKLEKLDIYWEDNAKILIASDFLNSCIEEGKLQEKYYINLKNAVRFEKFEELDDTKYIIQDFNFSINLGTRNETKKLDLDIFNLTTPPSMMYFQLASNELNINIYPDFIKILINFNEFLAQFPIIDKVKDYRPFIKPSKENSMNYINLVENYKKNVIENGKKNKLLVRDWINYFYWFQKSKNGEKKKIINPLRTEFVRFYNICIKKVDIHEIKELKEKEKNNTKNTEFTTTPNPNPEDNPQSGTPIQEETPTPTPEGNTPNPEKEEKLIPKELDFSSRIDLLIKGFNINLHSPLEGIAHDYISLSINGIEIKIKLNKEKFELNFKIKTFDLGPSNLIMGERIIIQPKSYRKAIPEQSMTSLKSNIPYGNLSKYNYVSLPNSELGSNITGLIKKYNPKHERKIQVIDEALELAESHSKIMSLAVSEFDNTNKYRNSRYKTKTPFGNPEPNPNLTNSVININTNMNDLGKTYGAVFVPRNVSFAKNLIDNYETNPLQNKRYERKKNKEMNISQAINDYNSYKNLEKSKSKSKISRFSRSPQPLSSSRFNLRESQFGINPKNIRGKKVPLNLLEIFSNTEVGALSIKFTKYNNPITIDNLAVELGTIRLNLYVNYLLDILRILSDYKKATMIPKIVKSEQIGSPSGKMMLEVEEYFYNYLNKIPNQDKTESMIEYMDYLKKKISSKKKFSPKPEHFALNQIFSIFPKGFDFIFDYENIEVVAYDKNNSVSSKVIIPSNECVFGINFSKIFVKLFDLEVEVTDLNKIESISNQLKELAEDKFKVVQIVIEPCYKQIKEGIEPLIKNEGEEYKQILRGNNINNNNINNNINNINNNINYINNVSIDDNKDNNQEQLLMQQKQKDKELLDLMIKNHKENEFLIKKQKEQKNIIDNRMPLDKDPKINISVIPKNPQSLHANYFQQQQYQKENMEIENEPRDSKRSKKGPSNNQDIKNIKYNLPKVGKQQGGSYQLFETNNLNNLNIQNQEVNGINNNNIDNNNYINFLSNTNYNMNVPNFGANYEQNGNYNERYNNNIYNNQNLDNKEFNLI